MKIGSEIGFEYIDYWELFTKKYQKIGISINFGDFGNFLVPPLISKNLKAQIQILKMLICRGEMISFPPSPTKAIYEMKPFMFLPVQCIADEKYHFKMTLISAFVIIQRSYTIISFISVLRIIQSYWSSDQSSY